MEINNIYSLLPFFVLIFSLLILHHLLRHPASPHPPSPPTLPIIGHLHLLSSMPHHSFASLSSRLKTPLLYLKLGQVPFIIVSSPRLARAILTTHDSILASRPSLLSAQYLSFGCSDVTFSPAGSYHRQARRIIMTELLSTKRVASFHPIRSEELNHLLSHISSSEMKPIDMSALFMKLANNVLCRVAFGRRYTGVSADRLPQVLEEVQELFAGFTIGDFFPSFEWLISRVTGLKRRLERCQADLSAVGDEIIRDHLERKEGKREEEEDFVDVLIRVQKSDNLEVPITDDNLKALVLDMFVAGTDTTFATLEWVMTELVRHPKILEKAQREVRGILGNKGRVEETDLAGFHFLKSIIKEVFRIHPAVPLLVPRESIAGFNIDGYEIPTKTRILINTYAMGRDPTIWEDPLEFKPDRFTDREIDLKGQKYFELLPFGGGRRGCPGYSFALATVEITLASFLYHFDWELPPDIAVENIDTSEIFGLATRKKNPLVLVARNSEGYEFRGNVNT